MVSHKGNQIYIINPMLNIWEHDSSQGADVSREQRYIKEHKEPIRSHVRVDVDRNSSAFFVFRRFVCGLNAIVKQVTFVWPSASLSFATQARVAPDPCLVLQTVYKQRRAYAPPPYRICCTIKHGRTVGVQCSSLYWRESRHGVLAVYM